MSSSGSVAVVVLMRGILGRPGRSGAWPGLAGCLLRLGLLDSGSLAEVGVAVEAVRVVADRPRIGGLGRPAVESRPQVTGDLGVFGTVDHVDRLAGVRLQVVQLLGGTLLAGHPEEPADRRVVPAF